MTVTKEGPEPLLCSSYSVKREFKAHAGDAFAVHSEFDCHSLIAGQQATLKVTVEVKQQGAEHAMIEVPIPAGCSYASKQANLWYSNAYRESYKDKTVIFIENLPIGTYTYDIDLLPRFTGTYTLNPAKVELMYFPVVNANNEAKEVGIKEEK